MRIPIQLLLIEDSEDDAELLLRELRRNNYEPNCLRVETQQEMSRALQERVWDLIISDYTLPDFSGLAALELAKAYSIDIPIIIISGAVGEEIAVKTMKAGAHDYIMKDNMTRLIPAIERELKEAGIRVAHKWAQETVQHLTYHDSLTGLLNRTEFERRVELAIESAITQKRHHAICMLDLDQFKVINDTCGHIAGDEMLKQLATLIQSHLNEGDILARLGGDEFGILIENCTTEDANKFAEELLLHIKNFRFEWQGESHRTGASIGLVPIDSNTQDSSKILSIADIACHTAKEMGRNRIYLFEEGDKTLSLRHGEMQWVNRISKALQDNRFTLFRQNIIPVNREDQTKYCEILIRMVGENGKLIAPGEFIPAAERYTLMPAIDRWVVDKVFSLKSELKETSSQEENVIFCTINLSGASLNDNAFLNYIREKSLQYEIPSESICFEITETAAIENITLATHFINELKTLGFRFALDDFGSGLSSFNYLKRLNVDYIKIDGYIVREIAQNKVNYTMVEAINRIGQVMGIKTIAEFVENEEIFNKLKEIGVDYAQGYWINKPYEICG